MSRMSSFTETTGVKSPHSSVRGAAVGVDVADGDEHDDANVAMTTNRAAAPKTTAARAGIIVSRHVKHEFSRPCEGDVRRRFALKDASRRREPLGLCLRLVEHDFPYSAIFLPREGHGSSQHARPWRRPSC